MKKIYLFLCVSVLLGCKPSNPLLGKWQAIHEKTKGYTSYREFEFLDNGTCIQVDNNMLGIGKTPNTVGTYSINFETNPLEIDIIVPHWYKKGEKDTILGLVKLIDEDRLFFAFSSIKRPKLLKEKRGYCYMFNRIK